MLNNISNIIQEILDKFGVDIVKLYSARLKKLSQPNLKTIKIQLSKVDKHFIGLEKQLVANIINATEKHMRLIESQTGISLGRQMAIKHIRNTVHNYISVLPQKIRGEVIEYITFANVTTQSPLSLVKLSLKIQKTIKKTSWLIQETSVVIVRKDIDSKYKRIEKKFKKPLYYQYVGPLDKKTSKECSPLVGKTMTRQQWEQIKSDIFINGMHPGCRHSLVLNTDYDNNNSKD